MQNLIKKRKIMFHSLNSIKLKVTTERKKEKGKASLHSKTIYQKNGVQRLYLYEFEEGEVKFVIVAIVMVVVQDEIVVVVVVVVVVVNVVVNVVVH
jgi:hypothetical protein